MIQDNLLQHKVMKTRHYFFCIISFCFMMSLVLLPYNTIAQNQTQNDQTSAATKNTFAPTPDIAELVPRATDLTGNLATLEQQLGKLVDIHDTDSSFTAFNQGIEDPEKQLKALKDSTGYRHSKLVELKKDFDSENQAFEEISAPLKHAITTLGTWRKNWLKEQKLWKYWEDTLLKEGQLEQLNIIFRRVNNDIDKALNLIQPELEARLKVQEKGYQSQVKIMAMTVEIEGLINVKRQNMLNDASPPMLSSRYFAQFSNELWHNLKVGFRRISWPDANFFSSEWWIILLQLFASVLIILSIFRHRKKISDPKHYAFLAKRPVAAGVFIGIMLVFVFYLVYKTPDTWILLITIVGGVSFARLISAIADQTWKKRFVWVIVMLLIITRIFDVISLPLPIYRFYIVVIAIIGLFKCYQWIKIVRTNKGKKLFIWLLNIIVLLLIITIFSELIGKEALALYLYESMLRTLSTLLVFFLFMYLIHGGIEWIFLHATKKKSSIAHGDIKWCYFQKDSIAGILFLRVCCSSEIQTKSRIRWSLAPGFYCTSPSWFRGFCI